MTHASCDAVELSSVNNHGMSSNTFENNIVKKPHGDYGCQFIGSIKVEKVSGKVLVQHIGRPNLFNMMDFLTMNSSHSIRYFRIGTWFPTMIMPLINVDKTIPEQGKLDLLKWFYTYWNICI